MSDIQDAERYRFLRDFVANNPYHVTPEMVVLHVIELGPTLDDAVDNMMRRNAIMLRDLRAAVGRA